MSATIASVLGVAAGLLLASAGWALALRRWSRRTPPAGAPERAELLSKIAHELKNPIMSVKGLAATGSRLYASMSDEERREFFQLIDSEATRLQSIAEATSTALKIDAGAIAYDLRSLDVGKLVQEVAWRARIGAHAMVVEADEGLTAPVDRARLAEVIAHLIENAAKYSPPDAPIEVRAYRVDGGIAIEVADRGPGIPPEHRGSVFEKYASWRPPGYEETPGAGLGLFICRAHLKAHGGRIDIVDEQDRGTMLRVTLPAGG